MVNFKNNVGKKIDELNLLHVKLFYNFDEQGKIALLFDGFDKISLDYKKQVINLLRFLKGISQKKYG
jgi:hypothetical protein